jgi:hypothetical protein
MKYKLRIIQEFEAENEEAAQKFVMDQIQTGIKQECFIEVSRDNTPEEIEAKTQISFHNLLNNLNSGDMTKN